MSPSLPLPSRPPTPTPAATLEKSTVASAATPAAKHLMLITNVGYTGRPVVFFSGCSKNSFFIPFFMTPPFFCEPSYIPFMFGFAGFLQLFYSTFLFVCNFFICFVRYTNAAVFIRPKFMITRSRALQSSRLLSLRAGSCSFV